MHVTATEAKNRLGQMLDLCQQAPVTIEKSGRRHSVLLSAAQYDALVVAAKPRAAKSRKADPGLEFYAQNKQWMDHINAQVEEQGLWNNGLRVW
jgi:prevent-host-death family protein